MFFITIGETLLFIKTNKLQRHIFTLTARKPKSPVECARDQILYRV